MSIDYYERLPQPDKHDQTNDFNNYKDKSEFFNRAYESRLGFTRADSRQKECEVTQNPDLIITSISKNIPAKFESFIELKLMIINALRNNQSCRPEKI